jgi:nucleoside-diphosphate-sugar epimerase
VKVFITGANGFIGSNLCRHFLARGWDVAGLVRPTADRHYLDGLAMEVVVGDLLEPDGFAVPQGLDALVHSASVVSDFAGDGECRANILRIAETLTEKIRALPKPLPRIIVLSTSLSLGFAAANISEERPGRSAEFLAYTRYKKKSEEYLLGQWKENRLPVVILRPGDVYGPRDRTTLIKLIRAVESGFPIIVGRGQKRFAYLHIDNLCQAVELAILKPGIEGRTYTVTNGELPTWKQFFGALMEAVGRKQRVIVPAWAAYVWAFLQSSLHALVPRYTPQLNRYRVMKAASETTYDISRTIADLGYAPDDRYKDQVRAMVAWYNEEKKNGFIS